MTGEVITAFAQLGAVGLMLWWLTQKLVPQLQKERSDTLNVFREEMEKERTVHSVINQRLSDRSDKIMEVLVRHFEDVHGAPRV